MTGLRVGGCTPKWSANCPRGHHHRRGGHGTCLRVSFALWLPVVSGEPVNRHMLDGSRLACQFLGVRQHRIRPFSKLGTGSSSEFRQTSIREAGPG
ncbi:protein of unknown function [Methylorubrum extorquens DM4]|uniref:Uncharacterized protein n=1 Tax=Methylorubrum extorquens (strain DSM 6343 / CIP 106787 / DM4) TaxID=661410 RepID=C7CGG7_METED|nr:protein of unknown function [Methylorubrum extorquens DM4]